MTIHSNVAEAIYNHAGHPATCLPRLYERFAKQSNLEFDPELIALGEQIVYGEVVIPILDLPSRMEKPVFEDILTILDLTIQVHVEDHWDYKLAEHGENNL
jgi:hypothetical protein